MPQDTELLVPVGAEVHTVKMVTRPLCTHKNLGCEEMISRCKLKSTSRIYRGEAEMKSTIRWE